MKTLLITDERMESVNGRISFILLMITHIMLGLSLVYRAYILDMDSSEYRDISTIILVSTYGYWALRLYFGSLQPKLSLKRAIIIYLVTTVLLASVLSLWLGLPALENWVTTILPVIIGPAILVGGFYGLAYLGKRRMDKEIDEE